MMFPTAVSSVLTQTPIIQSMPVSALFRLAQTSRRIRAACEENAALIVQRMSKEMVNRCSTDARLPKRLHRACIERRIKIHTLASRSKNGHGFVQISAGYQHSLGLLNNGQVVGWGHDWSGRASGGAAALPEKQRCVQVSAGCSHSLGLLDNGQVVGWGSDFFTQASGGMTALPAGRRVVQVSAGAFHSLGLLDNGQVVGWGFDRDGQASGGAAALPPGRRYVQVSAGYSHSLGLLDNGQVVDWGSHGNEHTIGVVPVGRRLVQVSVGYHCSLGLLDDGTIVGWRGNGCDRAKGLMRKLRKNHRFIQISAGDEYSVGLMDNGIVTEAYNDRVTVSFCDLNCVHISECHKHYFALSSDGKVIGWGNDDVGQQSGHATALINKQHNNREY